MTCECCTTLTEEKETETPFCDEPMRVGSVDQREIHLGWIERRRVSLFRNLYRWLSNCPCTLT